MDPVLSFYTPTYRRPQSLARCLASVQAQTAVARVDHLVVIDHVGRGIPAMYATVPRFAGALRGRYVHLLCDDDVLATPGVVAAFEAFAASAGWPEVVIAFAQKGGQVWPDRLALPLVEGHVDLACVITRRDIWTAHCTAYGIRYEGDFDFVQSLQAAGRQIVFWPALFVVGAVSNGRPEGA